MTAVAESAAPLLDALIEQGAEAARAVADEIRRKVRIAARGSRSPALLLREARRVLALHEPILARTVGDTLLAAWLTGADRALSRLSPDPAGPLLPPVEPPPLAAPGDPEPLVRYPITEGATRDLLNRRLLTRPEFDALTEDAKAGGFTVARVSSLDALDRLRDVLLDNIAQGGTLRGFSAKVSDILGASALSEWHIETVYRTNVASAYTQGLVEVLGHPLVSDEFPYLEYVAVHDRRARPEHRAMERHGIGGGSVYRRDDPVWEKFLPPWDYNCRCMVIPLSVEDAARKGVGEAQRWQETSIPPSQPAFVTPPPFEPPPGWARRGRLEPVV